MFKYKEEYIISLNNKDKGILTILSIVNKKNYKVRRRLHKNSKMYKVLNFN